MIANETHLSLSKSQCVKSKNLDICQSTTFNTEHGLPTESKLFRAIKLLV